MGKNSPLRLIEDPATELPAILTVPEVAAYLGVGEAVVYEAIKQGLPHLRMGRLIRVPRAELLAWQRDSAHRNAALPGSNRAAFDEEVQLGQMRSLSRKL